MSTRANPIFCALDTNDLQEAQNLAKTLRPHIGGFKLGLEFFLAHGAEAFRSIAQIGAPIFLDLKLHDIPNTVAGAIASLLPLRPAFLTLHTAGGPAMLQAAAKSIANLPPAERPKLLGVTVLTSLDSKDLAMIGQDKDVLQQSLRLAKLAQDSGLDGIVCSPNEVKPLRQACGPDFILMVPGIRPSWAAQDDQKRTLGPKEAMEAGASYLVIGRPITAAAQPAEAAARIAAEVL